MAIRSTAADPLKAPSRAHWSAIGDGGHAVQFYSHDGILIDLLSRYVGTALVSGDAAVVVATRAHRAGLERHLRVRGLDTTVARDQGRYVFLDGDEARRRIFLDGSPNGDMFRQIVGAAIEGAAAAANRDPAKVVVFGEMIALVWTAEQLDAAIRLEEFWNELARAYAFSLCCAYPMTGFGNEGHAAPFLKICAQHTHVFPAERRSRPGLR